ncbi:hypothetical protein LCGC14_1404020 [marine sediment metagenome]|uniref:SAP domain-containing protein n=1 Tax=marine sediment metagenome TaxID=412755 RepID=A0A0F9MBN2_9ZZZZ
MKRLQEFSNKQGVYTPNISAAIKSVVKLPLPYTGNKKKLLTQIHSSLKQHNVEFDSVVDAFSGSASVSLLFKIMGKKVISNDLLTSSYLNSVAFVENPGIKISEEEQIFLLNHKNSNKSSFVEDNYLGSEFTPKGKKCRFNKFTLKECQDLDNFRANINELCGVYSQSLGMAANMAVVMRLPFGSVDASVDILKHRRRQEEIYGKTSNSHDRRIGIYYDDNYNLNFDKWFCKYLSDFMMGRSEVHPPKIKRAAFLANIQQHVLRDCMVGGRMNQGQSLAEVKDRLKHQKNQLKASWRNKFSTEMDFRTKEGIGGIEGKPGQGLKWWTFADLQTNGSCLATNMDATDLLNLITVDCAYFDLPYGGPSSDYVTMYRFFEEYVYSDVLENLPHVQNARKFVNKKQYEENFIELLEAARHIPIWLFSFNDNSWTDIKYIASLLNQFKDSIIIDVLTDSYRYLYREKQGRDKKGVEYLVIAR